MSHEHTTTHSTGCSRIGQCKMQGLKNQAWLCKLTVTATSCQDTPDGAHIRRWAHQTVGTPDGAHIRRWHTRRWAHQTVRTSDGGHIRRCAHQTVAHQTVGTPDGGTPDGAHIRRWHTRRWAHQTVAHQTVAHQTVAHQTVRTSDGGVSLTCILTSITMETISSVASNVSSWGIKHK